jgi:hypothetical protein
VRYDETRAYHKSRNLRPDFSKSWFVLYVLPGDPVNICEDKFSPRGANQPTMLGYYFLFFDSHQSERAGAIPAVVGGLEVEGDE